MNERDQDRADEQVEGQCPMCGAPAVSSHSRQGRIGLTSWRYQAPAPAAAPAEVPPTLPREPSAAAIEAARQAPYCSSCEALGPDERSPEHCHQCLAIWLGAAYVVDAALPSAGPSPDARQAAEKLRAAVDDIMAACVNCRAKLAQCAEPCAHHAKLFAAASEAGLILAGLSPTAVLRDALLNVSVHSAHLPGAPHELLIELLAKCGQIARAALAGGDHA